MSAAPRYGWYGDDFTGATDTLATLAEQGLKALLFLALPTPEQLAAADPLDAVGIAGATRAMAPEATAAELEPAGRFFAGLGVEILHYKCCSTFDSAPHVGNIGAAVRALRPHFPNPLLPIIGGQPNLGRYCLFGNLFAAAGRGGSVHRIDRHPTMSVHPVTPMDEADLRLHLARQGLGAVALVDYRALDGAEASSALAYAMEQRPEAVLFDVSRASDLRVIGDLIRAAAHDGPMLVIGPSSVAQMWSASTTTSAPAASQRRPGSVLVLVGSLSPVTRAQVEAASGFVQLHIDTRRLIEDAGYAESLRVQAQAHLAQGDTMLVTDPPEGVPEDTAAVASATGRLLRAIMDQAEVSRLVVAGGDTSTLAVKSLDIWGLSYRAPFVAGAPLCRAHSADTRLDGLDIILKGGQMGPPDVFAKALG